MRTTLTIDPDVAMQAKEAIRLTGLPFKTLINSALRIGIDAVVAPKTARPYRTQGHPMGLRKGLSYDNIHELLAIVEKEDFR
jgi:hypothetical protein